MNNQHIPAVQTIRGRKLWFGLAATLAAFAIDGYLAFVITWRTCFIGHGQLGALSLGGVRWLLVGITIGLFVLSVIGGVTSYGHWKQLSGEREMRHAESSGTAEFVAMLTVLASVALSVGIVWLSLPLIFIDVCMRAH
ncbi:MAG TPA: hypothetical protein VFW94_22845 [Candidatus Acidoferrales bacterium]|nr:hypothetical protein [Candidatus Acidoferrales bacterium]